MIGDAVIGDTLIPDTVIGGAESDMRRAVRIPRRRMSEPTVTT